MIVATGTGATGWAASINRERSHRLELPQPNDPALAWFVREAWPSIATGTSLTEGVLSAPERVAITSELGDGAVVFGDGIEADRLQPDWGQRITVGVAGTALALVA